MAMMRKFFPSGPAALLIAVALAACGGGDGGANGGGSKLLAEKVGSLSAMADAGNAELNQQVSVPVLANDSILGGGKLMLASVTAPAHGTATISGDKVVYTPATGYFGPDSFSYTVKATGGDTATALVAMSVKASLVLRGRAVEVPPSAAVTIAGGAATVNTTTDASGNYSAPLVLDTPASMITVTVQGSGSAAHIKLISMVGDSQQALNAAGAGGALTPEQSPGLLVTSMSTSLYANAILRNGGTPPASQQAFEYAARGVSYSELMQMAALVRSLTGEVGEAAIHTLPPGAADTLALVTNRALYTTFVRLIHPAILYQEEQRLSSDLRLASLPSLDIHGSKSLVLHNSSVCCSGPAYELVINANGSGSFSREQRRWAGTWRKGATMTLALTVPEVRTDYVANADMQNVEGEFTTREITLRQHTGTAKYGFVTVTYSGTATYPYGQLPDGPFERSEVWAFDDWDNARAPADLSGAVLAGLPTLAVDPTYVAGQMVVTLGADGRASSPQYPGKMSTWSIRKGKLDIALTGIIAEPDAAPVNGSLSMGLLHVRPNGEEHWLVRSTLPAGELLHEVVIVRPQPGLAFTDANAVMSLTSGASSNVIGWRTLYTIAPDHTGSQDGIDHDGVFTWPIARTSWAIEGGTLVMRTYRVGRGFEQFATCPSGQVCSLASERIWTLLQSDAASVTVLDSYRNSFLPPRYRVLRLSRN